MEQVNFEGRDELVEALDNAVACDDDEETTERIRRVLCQFIREGTVRLPDSVLESSPEHYTRRLLHKSDELGYSIMAMTWGPGQGTPLHDHCGMWCVEGVCEGELEVTQYELVERDEDRYRFETRGVIQAGTGSAGSLIPPHEYHTIENADTASTAVSIHIYSGEMTNCNTFEPVGDGWYQRRRRELGYDGPA